MADLAVSLLGDETGVVEHLLGDATYDTRAVHDDTQAHLIAQFQPDMNLRNSVIQPRANRIDLPAYDAYEYSGACVGRVLHQQDQALLAHLYPPR